MANPYQGRVSDGVYRTLAGPTPRYRATVTRIFDSLEDAVNWRTPLLVPRQQKRTKQTSITFTAGFVRMLDATRGALTRPAYLRQLALPMLRVSVLTPRRDPVRRKRMVMWLHLDLLAELDAVRGNYPRGHYLETLLTPELRRINQHTSC